MKKPPQRKKMVYSSGESFMEIIIRDSSGKKELMLKARQTDHKSHSQIGSILMGKYGIDLSPGRIKDDFFDF